MTTAFDVAKYILSTSSPEEGDIISHLKLQKLLYYCQGFHLAISNTPLFNEAIYHWDYGPVAPDVYDKYKEFGNNALDVPNDFDDSIFPSTEKEIIDEVLNVYGQFSAWKLSDMTHSEPPWSDSKDNEEISHKQLKTYFSSQIIDKGNND